MDRSATEFPAGRSEPSPPHGAARCQAVERGAAVLLLVALAPLLLGVAGAIRLAGGGPVLVRKQRLTADGRSSVLAFRTDARRSSALGPAPPPGRFGGMLLRTSLDELPHLIDVARGRARLLG